jgi:outer membrane protein
MKKKALWMGSGFVLAVAAYMTIGATAQGSASKANAQIAVVNFKKCIETSKLGKQEQGRFEEIKKQMETGIEAKEKELNEMAPKFKDEYLDTLTPEAEAELKERFRRLSQELSGLQNQYYQLLNQANYQIVQKMNEWITGASSKIAKDKNIDIVLNDEACFYVTSAYDVSSEIVKELDARFAQEEKTQKTSTEKK